MAVNKVIYGGETLVDLTGDTVTAETLAQGETAHDASGNLVRGVMPTTAVLYTRQSLSEAQKAQARQNLGVGSIDEVAEEVLARLKTPVFGRVDADNNIILTGELADGTYTIKYEDADGTVTEIGTLNHTVVPEPTYTNLLPLAINSDGTPYNGGQGWKTGYRLNSSGAETAQAGIEISGFMPVTDSDTVYFSNIEWSHTHAEAQYCYVAFYNSAFELVTSKRFSAMATNNDGRVFDSNNNVIAINVPKLLDYYGFTSAVAYMRISAITITGDSIITKNEPIE